MKNYSLVLSGGGALGYAHLGILEDLENLAMKNQAKSSGPQWERLLALPTLVENHQMRF